MNKMKILTRKLNRKGVALMMVVGLIVVMLPVLYIFSTLGSSQKNQSINFNDLLKVEQTALSGINAGFSRLRSGDERGYRNYSGELSGNDHYDLNLTPTGKGFFKQDIYMMLSKSEEGKHSSIILSDAEQFQKENEQSPVLVITHDYWTKQEPYELSVAADVLSMKNDRGKDQLRNLDVKKYEMTTNADNYKNALQGLKGSLPSEMQDVWDKVVENLVNDKISE